MKKLFTSAIVLLFCLTVQTVFGQFQYGVNPSDPDVIFTQSNRPAVPGYGDNGIVKWGHTNRLGWNPYSKGYRSYLYQGMAFRLKFPKTYQPNVADGKKYPLFIFFHGMGERGDVYDNEYQLLHGGETHANKVNDGTFDGYLFYAQNTAGYSQGLFSRISDIIDSLSKNYKVDIDRVIISGLSSGGQSAWEFMQNSDYAKKVSASLPISAASTLYPQYFPGYITIPIWVTNGGQDGAPAPYTVTEVITQFRNLGGNLRQTLYPNLGHGVWNNFWSEPDYFPYLSTVHKANPLVYFQRSEFCPTDPVNVKLGVFQGFYAYEWQKNNVTIPGENSNTLQVNSYGSYSARYKRTASSDWSVWSPIPAVISQKQGTVSPPIHVEGMFSSVLPSVDGSTTTPLSIPNTYASYEWRRISDNAVVSTTNNLIAPVGQYKVKVTEQFGCSSNFSDVFSVISANGTNLPDKASNLSATALSSVSILLDWNDNPTPAFNETAFEVYRSTTPGTGYKMVGKVNADIITFTDNGLTSNTKYYYVVRAINNNGASLLSSEVSVLTKSDVTPPSVPTALTVNNTGRNSVNLSWNESIDNAGPVKYEVYVNGVKTYITNKTEFTVNNLTYLSTYSFYVKARDLSGNLSAPSNVVNATAALGGLSYKYYEGDWNVLPDFNALTPVITGNSPTVTISPKLRGDYFGFLWEGFIKIPASGTYTFETNSDDGSKLYIGEYSFNATPVVDNDGLHGGQFRSGTIYLAKGVYPFAATFFEKGGGELMEVYWKCIAAGILNRTAIPSSAFTDNVSIPASDLPTAPNSLSVSSIDYKSLSVSWNDMSNNETGFEIIRSENASGPFIPVGLVGTGVTTFIDSIGLNPLTTYYYKVRSVNNSGSSEFIGDVQAKWALNNDLNDLPGYNRTLTAVNNPSFSTDRKEGSHSLVLNGTNQYADMSFSSGKSFPSNSYGTRTVAMWIKPDVSMLTATNKTIIDLGGNDNGFAIRFNSKALQVGIARNNTRHIAALTNASTDGSWVYNGWNHIAAVYNGTNIKLFVNGQEKASTILSVSNTKVVGSNSLSRIGGTNGTNAFSSLNSYFQGSVDEVQIINEALDAQGIVALMNQNYGFAKTAALPALPATPTNLVAVAPTYNKVNINWIDASNNETGFELYRSVGTSGNYRLVETLAAGTISYTDNNLFANTNYYYKVRAIGIGGNSPYSNESIARTQNNKPVIAKVESFGIRYGTQATVNFTATDVDGEALTMTIKGKPSFATFTSGNGTAALQLSPAVSNIGSYPVSVIATDGNNGADTTSFVISVSSNYIPVISPVNNVTVNEGTSNNVQLSATDADGNASLVWSKVSGPSFAGVTSGSNGAGTLTLTPGYANSGTYIVKAKVEDGNGGVAYVSINVLVNDAEPTAESIYMSTVYQSPAAPAPWNNLYNVTTNNLKNSNGVTTTVGIEFLGTPWNAGDAGAVTGNNSGVYPDAVIRDYFWFGIYGAPETVNVKLKGLTVGSPYNVTLFGSSSWTGAGNNGTTVYTINGVAKSLYVDKNNQNTVTFNSILPDATGNIIVNMSKAANTPYGMVNAIVLQKPFNDGTTPIDPENLTATAQLDGTIKLTWADLSYNESMYMVYRSTNEAGPYTALTPSANANDVTFIDNNAFTNTTYFYKVQGVNENGTSNYTNVASATATNRAPAITFIDDVIMNASTNSNVSVIVTDPGDVISIEVTGLPVFASYQNTGNGTGTISFNPTIEDAGNYFNIKVIATDNFGGRTTQSFNLTVLNPYLRSVYINFGSQESTPQPSPWNNFLSYTYANDPISNLIDNSKVNTVFSLRLLAQWQGNQNFGMVTGNNSGIFADNVIRSSFYSSSTSARVIQIEGLSTGKAYNVAIF
ncbi:MAG: LamG-like jellyroll fold domain-containing protein, partial [Ferruginibacter sp.]